MGNIYNNAGYPLIDAGNGGTLDGMLHTCRTVLDSINADAVVIPGHGPLASLIDLQSYVKSNLRYTWNWHRTNVERRRRLVEWCAKSKVQRCNHYHGVPVWYRNIKNNPSFLVHTCRFLVGLFHRWRGIFRRTWSQVFLIRTISIFLCVWDIWFHAYSRRHKAYGAKWFSCNWVRTRESLEH